MSLARLFLPLLFACSLLLAQQGGIAHALSHTLATQQQDEKPGTHPHNCELCALDAQLGSALNSTFFSFALALLPASTWTHCAASFQFAHTLTATARGPPVTLREFA
jgi:hypothetical protein